MNVINVWFGFQRTAKFTWIKNAIPWISVQSSISHIMRTTLNPAHTLAGVGREHRLIWRKKWFILQVETGIIHPQAMETEPCNRHDKTGITGHQGCWCHCTFPIQHRPFVRSSATTTPVFTSRTKLKAVLCDLVCERRKKSPLKSLVPFCLLLPMCHVHEANVVGWWVLHRTWQKESASMSRKFYPLYILFIIPVKELSFRKGENKSHNSSHSLHALSQHKTK